MKKLKNGEPAVVATCATTTGLELIYGLDKTVVIEDHASLLNHADIHIINKRN